MSKTKIIICLTIISVISLIMKLSLADFSSYLSGDPKSYMLYAFSFVNGDFTPIFNVSSGWSYFLSLFFNFFDSNDFIFYGNLVRIISISLVTLTIVPMYLLARKWFSIKYALIAVCFFAFEPHLTYLSTLGYSESLYIPVFLITLYFISTEKYRNICLSFIFAGLLWWIRWPGIIIVVALSLIFLVNFRKIPKNFSKYILCLGLFLLVISPMLLERYNEFGDPLYLGATTTGIFSGDYAPIQGNMVNVQNNFSAMDYINENGLPDFFNKFIVTGIMNISLVVIKNLFPFLIILVPIGMLFSLQKTDQDKKFIRGNWIIILTTLVTMTITFSIISEKRFLYPLLPFFILFAVIPVQRLVEYGLSTFSFSLKQKNIVLIIIILLVLLSSILFMQRYDTINETEYTEKINFSKYVLNNLEGKMLDAGGTGQGIGYLLLNDPVASFKTFQNSEHKYPKDIILDEGYILPLQSNDKIIMIGIYAKSMHEFIIESEKYDLKYISIKNNIYPEKIYPYLSELYSNESKYPFLIKIFDSNEEGYEEFKVKIFEINYKKYHSLYD